MNYKANKPEKMAYHTKNYIQETIKPCPFCGKIPEIANSFDLRKRHVVSVSCNNRGCFAYNAKSFKQSRSAAIKIWNERAA